MALKRSAVAAAALLSLTALGACGRGSDDFQCPLTAAKVSAILGKEVPEPRIKTYDKDTPALFEMYGESYRGCEYGHSVADRGALLGSVASDTADKYQDQLSMRGDTFEFEDRLWVVEVGYGGVESLDIDTGAAEDDWEARIKSAILK